MIDGDRKLSRRRKELFQVEGKESEKCQVLCVNELSFLCKVKDNYYKAKGIYDCRYIYFNKVDTTRCDIEHQMGLVRRHKLKLGSIAGNRHFIAYSL